MYSNYFEILKFKNPREIQVDVKKVIEDNKENNVLVIAGCGSGKTEIGNYFLLNKNGKRSIFIEPMRTLATSIQKRLDEYNKELNIEENWTIQHSSNQEDRYLENKYVVTTIDQVLAGWLGIGRHAFIKGKNVLLSNFVFDEVQLFQPDKTLLTTINFLDSIKKSGNKFLIMTATMPKYLINFLSKRYDMKVVIAEKEEIKDRKIYVNFKESLDFSKINGIKDRQIIICNTQSQQEHVYNEIKDKERCIILNSKFLSTDRKNIESELDRYFSKKSKANNKILIATSIVEVGLDISCKYLYSYGCPIDKFIQRCGRCARWGGTGFVKIIQNDDNLFDEEVVKKTLEFFKKRPDLNFIWEIQKDAVSEILDEFYRDAINEVAIRKNKIKLANGSLKDLVREIYSCNIIIDNNISTEISNINSFNRQSISISLPVLKKLSKTNKLFILNKNIIEKTSYSDKLVSETVIIKGNDCVYDKVGFRYKEGEQTSTFKYFNEIKDKYNMDFVNYKNETWITHATIVKALVKQKILNNKFSNYIMDNCEKISLISGLHDIGKLDEVWQGKQWAQAGSIPLAHFPFRTSNPNIFKNRNHKFIGAILLKNFCNDDLLFNIPIQHHGRIISDKHDIEVCDFKLHKNYKLCLYELGFIENIEEEGHNLKINYKQILSPKNDNWNDFLYVIGILMEADIEAINLFHK
ncbi:CRISPR-associated helicase/endonuclease Cas3 [Clostridium sp. CTA-5]